MSVPDGDIICDECKAAWQLFSYYGYLGHGRHDAVQPGIQELQGQITMRLVQPEEAHDEEICLGEEGPDASFFWDRVL
jgi:hypothetical protein